MNEPLAQIRRVLRSARRRWMWLTILRCGTRAALSSAAVLLLAWLVVLPRVHGHVSPAAGPWLAALVLAAVCAAALVSLWPLVRRPSDAQVARLIEEHCPQIEDRLATAIECATPGTASHGNVLTDLLYRDAADRVADIDLDRAISRRALVRAAVVAAGSGVVCAALLLLAFPTVRDLAFTARPLNRSAGASPRPAGLQARPPAVTAVDLRYEYPASLKLAPRAEENTGDIYGPSGTRVHLRIHTDKTVRAGSLRVAGAAPATLAVEGERVLSTSLTITADGSYRVAVTGADGAENPGETEYFIRVLDDAPPNVSIVQPAADREVTPLEEVTIEARAQDDRGVKVFDLVYSVRGGPEAVVPFSTSGDSAALVGKRLLYLEDLHVHPGDFITYYARARDRAPGGAEARSDMFFLQVRPFEQEFMPPESSQAQSGGVAAPNQSLEDLIKAQKDIIVATWRLDRRARKNQPDRPAAAGSRDDARTIGRAQGELKTKTMKMAGAGAAGAEQAPALQNAAAGDKSDNGDPMATAVEAMARAEQSLNAARTADALPQETRALTELLKAQAANKRWQMKQASGARGGGDTGNTDLTSLFDQQLKREQRTNYETPRGAKSPGEQKQDEALERVRQLAQRQDELARQQQDLARDRGRMREEDVKRQLERLTREQSDLRREAEDLAQQTRNNRVRDASQAMGQAASQMRDGKLGEASARSGEARDRLRSAEEQMRAGGPGAASLGDLQMQAQQAAETQRQIARDAAGAPGRPGAMASNGQGAPKPGDPAMRRLAGEKERLADQVERLAQGVKSAAAAPGLEGRQREALDGVNRDLDRLQLPRQMRDQAQAMRSPEKADVNRPPSAAGEQDLANTLGRLTDRLAAAAASRETQQAAEQLGQARETRDRLAQIERRMSDLQRQARGEATDAQAGRGASGASPQAGKPVGTTGRDAPSGREEALKRLREEYARELQRAAEQLNRLGREGGGSGLTPEQAQSLSPLSARGYNQDYSKWEGLSREITAGLERAESALTGKLRDQQARDRLLAPAASAAPEQYRRLVEEYFASLARKKER